MNYYIIKTDSRRFILTAKNHRDAIAAVVVGTTWRCPWTGNKIAHEPPAAFAEIRPLGTMIPQ